MSVSISTRIRDLREQCGLSQRALAVASGISAAALSQIEAGQTSPSVATLEKLAGGMNVAVASFFLDVGEAEGIEVFSPEDRPHVRLLGGSCLTPLAAQRHVSSFEPVLIQLESGGELSDKPFGVGGKTEYVWIRRGKAQLEYENRVYQLNETQSVYYDPRKPHNWRNTSDSHCEILMIHSR